MIYKISVTICLLLMPLSAVYSQLETSIGGYAGGGFISANSPDEGAFTSSLFIESSVTADDFISARLSFIYATDFNSIIPGSRNPYFPSVRAVSVKGIYAYYMTYAVYIEQGLGLITMNDRIYSDRNNWDYGITVSLLAGIDLRKNNSDGLKTGIGTEYSLTFFSYSIQYFSVHFQLQYVF